MFQIRSSSFMDPPDQRCESTPGMKSLTIGQGAVMINDIGGMSEWFKEAVLKTVKVRAFGGSNPSPSATGRVRTNFFCPYGQFEIK